MVSLISKVDKQRTSSFPRPSPCANTLLRVRPCDRCPLRKLLLRFAATSTVSSIACGIALRRLYRNRYLSISINVAPIHQPFAVSVVGSQNWANQFSLPPHFSLFPLPSSVSGRIACNCGQNGPSCTFLFLHLSSVHQPCILELHTRPSRASRFPRTVYRFMTSLLKELKMVNILLQFKSFSFRSQCIVRICDSTWGTRKRTLVHGRYSAQRGRPRPRV